MISQHTSPRAINRAKPNLNINVVQEMNSEWLDNTQLSPTIPNSANLKSGYRDAKSPDVHDQYTSLKITNLEIENVKVTSLYKNNNMLGGKKLSKIRNNYGRVKNPRCSLAIEGDKY